MAIWRNNFFSQEIFPGFYARKANKKIQKNNKNLDEAIVEDIPTPFVALEELKIDIEKQSERKKSLEDKVKSILFSISISITAITFSLTYGKNGISNFVDVTAIVFLLVSIYYFIASATISVQTLMPIQFESIQMQSEYDNKKNTITLSVETDLDKYKRLMIAKFQNDSSNLQVANFTYAALTLLRNGIILFTLYFVIATAAKNIPNSFTDKTIVAGKRVIKLNDTINIVVPYSYEVEKNNTSNSFKIGVATVSIKRTPKVNKALSKKDTTKKLIIAPPK